MVKIVSWYDNEWGYSNRVVELAGKVLCARPGVWSRDGRCGSEPRRGRSTKASVRDAEVARPAGPAPRRPQRAARAAATVTDDTRIRAALPTIELLREARRVGRPLLAPRPARGPRPRPLDGAGRRAARRAARHRRRASRRASSATTVELAAAKLEPGDVLLLENTRYEPGETEQRPRAGRGARRARRPLRQRRLRRRPPRPRDDRRRRRATCRPTPACCSSARSAS